jgi:hypothetical protein
MPATIRPMGQNVGMTRHERLKVGALDAFPDRLTNRRLICQRRELARAAILADRFRARRGRPR